MKNEFHFILMADVINSRELQQEQLMVDLKKVVTIVNKRQKNQIISPLTITLGDEFQGIAKDLQSSVDIMIHLEECIIEEKVDFKLRYVLVQGQIDTPINKKIAYEMLGNGLTEARSNLSQLKNVINRFHFYLLNDELSTILNDTFFVYQGIVDDWQVDKDYEIVHSFLTYIDYKVVAEKLDRNRSLIWKREKTARIKEYLSLKNVISYLSNP